MMKRCHGCGILKHTAYYNKRRKSKDGLTPACRKCINTRRKEWKSPHVELKRTDKSQHASRVCLRCDRNFKSLARSNRICGKCKNIPVSEEIGARRVKVWG